MRPRRAAIAATAAAGAPFALVSAFHLVVLAAAARPILAPRRRAGTPPEQRMTVLIPAHDEERVIAATLRALADADFPARLLRVIVVADHCTDATAAIAQDHGATVWERRGAPERGKGRALEWALGRLADEADQSGYLLLVDADCVVSPDLLREVEAALRGGAAAVQTAHVVANPEASPVAALRYAGFRLVMTVRPAGMDALGLSAGLHGTGMGFRRDVLGALGWRSFSITEDLEQHLGLAERGHRVRALPHCTVASPAPLTHADAESQQVRWEGGRARLATRVAPAAILRGLRRRDTVLTAAAVELMWPPQSLQAAANVGLLAAGVALRSPALRRLGAASAAAQAGYVLGGLLVTRAPAPVWRALAQAPVLVARKLGVFGDIAAGRTPQEFVRTHRDAAAAPPAAVGA